MKRSMMQVYVKGSQEALELYAKAFCAQILCAYPDERGGYMHSELDAYGQIIAVSEAENTIIAGNTMMFCFHLGESHDDKVRHAYDVLRQDATSCTPLGPCDYSPYQFVLTDKFGVTWCVFV